MYEELFAKASGKRKRGRNLKAVRLEGVKSEAERERHR